MKIAPTNNTSTMPTVKNDVVISVEHLVKKFRFYTKPIHRILQLFWGKRKCLYHEKVVLNDINLEIHEGECIGIIGRNGAGKSTLLQLLTGTLRPTAGQIKIHGRIAALLELGSGFNPEFTGRENVILNAAILGLTEDEIRERFDKIVEFADIGEYIDRPVKTYSSGMMLRLAFSVIAHVDADVLIVDEALAVGDAFFVQKCMRFLRRFMEEHTVLFVSHDTSAVINLCNRAVLLEDGRVAAVGEPKEISKKYLTMLYQEQQDVDGTGKNSHSADNSPKRIQYRDARADFINHSNLRNDLELTEFSPLTAEAFGDGKVAIKQVTLCDSAGNPLNWVVGGELVKLRIEIQWFMDALSPNVGFFVRDRLGQNLFGDNTFIWNMEHAQTFSRGDVSVAEFCFVMPILPVGEYSICVAASSGTQREHVVHQWINEALLVTSHSSMVSSGLVGVCMQSIDFHKIYETGEC